MHNTSLEQNQTNSATSDDPTMTTKCAQHKSPTITTKQTISNKAHARLPAPHLDWYRQQVRGGATVDPLSMDAWHPILLFLFRLEFPLLSPLPEL